jgi:hypothetical protein
MQAQVSCGVRTRLAAVEELVPHMQSIGGILTIVFAVLLVQFIKSVAGD